MQLFAVSKDKKLARENKEMSDKLKRIKIVNKIIEVIARNGRNFFLNKSTGDVAYIFEKKGRLYMFSEYDKTHIYLHTKYGYSPKNFYHGGTMWALIKDFKEYIQKGGNTNHNNGYGGLYCPHWGYDIESMNKIRQTAKKLGYLHD